MNGFKTVVLGFGLILAGCATQGQVADMESTTETNQKILRENEMRLHNLENSVTALNTQIAQLNNRVYEVRTRNGQKTSMTVVPIVPGVQADSASSQNASPAAVKKPQASSAGKRIDPTAKPAPLAAQASTPAAAKTPANAGASGTVGQPSHTAGPAGQLAADTSLGLPPTDLPPSVPAAPAAAQGSHTPAVSGNPAVPVPTGNASAIADAPAAHPVPVPVLPATDIGLPPETSEPVAPVPAPKTANAPATTPRSATKSEEAAYNTALKAARSGHTEQGIQLFRDFLQQYPNSRYAANADYWIGECLYSQGKYQDALSQFQTVNTSFPTHHKNADALLKAGLTLSKLGDRDGAAEKYRTLISNFPNTEAARRARAMGGTR